MRHGGATLLVLLLSGCLANSAPLRPAEAGGAWPSERWIFGNVTFVAGERSFSAVGADDSSADLVLGPEVRSVRILANHTGLVEGFEIEAYAPDACAATPASPLPCELAGQYAPGVDSGIFRAQGDAEATLVLSREQIEAHRCDGYACAWPVYVGGLAQAKARVSFVIVVTSE